MRYDGLLDELILTYKGMLTSRMMDEHGIPRRELQALVECGKVIKKDRGLYVVKGYQEDPLVYGAYHYSKGIYDLTSVMFIYGYTSRPDQLTMAFPSHTNISQIHSPYIQPFTVNALRYKNGVRQMRTPLKTVIHYYGLSYALIHMIMRKNDIDPRLIQQWFIRFIRDNGIDALVNAARELRVESKLKKYLMGLDHMR